MALSNIMTLIHSQWKQLLTMLNFTFSRETYVFIAVGQFHLSTPSLTFVDNETESPSSFHLECILNDLHDHHARQD